MRETLCTVRELLAFWMYAVPTLQDQSSKTMDFQNVVGVNETW